MAEAVYVLCFLTSAAAAVLLLRAWVRTRTGILLWTGLGFVGLCLNNFMLILDAMIVPHIDLSVIRAAPAVAGMSLMLFGLIWNSE